MFLNNPYDNYQPGNNFGYSPLMPLKDSLPYTSQKGNPIFGNTWNVQFFTDVPPPASVTKAGVSLNIPPQPLPKDMIGIKFPQYSIVSHAPIENQRVGLQLGQPDVYRDNIFSNWTKGVQYYTIYEGSNPKNEITPIIYPQAYRPEIWAADTVTFDAINKEDTQDITELELDFTCRNNCVIPSASLATPVEYKPIIPGGNLDVQPIGAFPNIGQYTSRELGQNINSYPPKVNPIVEIQRRQAGLPPTPILSDFMNDEYTREIVQTGFEIV